MEPPQRTQAALFQVYLRLRPPPTPNQLYPILTTPERFLTVEEAVDDELPSHITLNPPNDNRRRAVEKFAFTKVFEESSSQLDIFQGTGVLPLVEGVLGPQGGEGRDGLLATLGVTGSGKSHTIMGSRNQRGLTQLALDVLFRSISTNILDPSTTTSLHASVAASDPSEAQVLSASMFIDSIYGDPNPQSRASSRATTPMVVRSPSKQFSLHPSSRGLYPTLLGLDTGSPKSIRVITAEESVLSQSIVSMAPEISLIPSFMRSTVTNSRKYLTKSELKGESYTPAPRRNPLQRPSVLPQLPDISNLTVDVDQHAEYAVLISMYEVYNDRIFDLLTPALPGKSTKDFRRRPLLFKPTEQSPDRKVVAGLRKVICGNMKEALMVLEAGLHERRVAGTGSNSVSSRSHGFFCVEVKKRRKSRTPGKWGGSALTIVDLAGSERARDAKTQGTTLQEAGKINESLMYLGQCLQMQSDLGSSTKPNLVPYRQCKLTELLFSNCFPSHSNSAVSSTASQQAPPSTGHRNPQKAIMIVTADPLGDFNATSQILRYSALAREVTVPRIPSVTSTILAQNASNYFSGRSTGGSDRSSPSDTGRETMELAALEIARMSEEIDGLRAELQAEQEQRLEISAHLETLRSELEDRLLEKEAEVREECYIEMEQKLQQEMQRWKNIWAMEQESAEEHLDRKIDLLTRGMDMTDEDKENANAGQGTAQTDDLEMENMRLRREVELLTRQLQSRSPTRRTAQPGPSGENMLRGGGPLTELSSVGNALERLRIASDSAAHGTSSPLRKVRKLTARKWDLMDEGEML